MALVEVLSILAVKTEGTPGSAETLATADANVLARNLTFTPLISSFERETRRGTYSVFPNVNGSQMATITFDLDLYGTDGSGTAAGFDSLMKACRFTSTDPGTMRILTAASSPAPCTIGWYVNGVRHQMYGALGNVVMNWTAGQPGVASFTMTGVLSAYSDQTILVATFPTSSDAPPPFLSAGFSLGGLSSSEAILSSVVIDMGNDVQMRADANNATGYKTAVIASSRPKLTVVAELTTAAEHNAQSIFAASTTAALAFAYGSSANKLSIAAPTVVMTGLTYPVQNGVQMMQIEGLLGSVLAAGNNELVITLGS